MKIIYFNNITTAGLFMLCFFVLSPTLVFSQKDQFANKFYINMYVQGLVQPQSQSVSLNEYNVNFLQNFPLGANINFEITPSIILHASLRMNIKKMEVIYNYERIEGDKYYLSQGLIDRNIKLKTLDVSVGVGYKYQYGRNVVIPYFDIRCPYALKENVEQYGMKEMGTNNYRIYNMDLDIDGLAIAFEAGFDYQLHFSKDRGFFGSVGYIYNKAPYRLNTLLDDNLYTDRIISNDFKLNESGFFVSAGVFYSFGNSKYSFPSEVKEL